MSRKDNKKHGSYEQADLAEMTRVEGKTRAEHGSKLARKGWFQLG